MHLFWLIDRDLSRKEIKKYFKNLYPICATKTQYQDFKWDHKDCFNFISNKLKILGNCFYYFQFYRMLLDILSNKLAIPLNKGKISHKQAEQKAFKEYNKFNKIQKIESDFDREIKKLLKVNKD